MPKVRKRFGNWESAPGPNSVSVGNEKEVMLIFGKGVWPVMARWFASHVSEPPHEVNLLLYHTSPGARSYSRPLIFPVKDELVSFVLYIETIAFDARGQRHSCESKLVLARAKFLPVPLQRLQAGRSTCAWIRPQRRDISDHNLVIGLGDESGFTESRFDV